MKQTEFRDFYNLVSSKNWISCEFSIVTRKKHRNGQNRKYSYQIVYTGKKFICKAYSFLSRTAFKTFHNKYFLLLEVYLQWFSFRLVILSYPYYTSSWCPNRIWVSNYEEISKKNFRGDNAINWRRIYFC